MSRHLATATNPAFGTSSYFQNNPTVARTLLSFDLPYRDVNERASASLLNPSLSSPSAAPSLLAPVFAGNDWLFEKILRPILVAAVLVFTLSSTAAVVTSRPIDYHYPAQQQYWSSGLSGEIT